MTIERAEDWVLTALTIGEQIKKRGEHGWMEPLIEEMGPWLMIQLADLSNLLEVILKYVPDPSSRTVFNDHRMNTYRH